MRRSWFALVVFAFLLLPMATAVGSGDDDYLSNSGSVHGVVYSMDTGEPIAGALVFLRHEDGAGTIIETTDGEGSFEFSAIPAGQYSMLVVDPSPGFDLQVDRETKRCDSIGEEVSVLISLVLGAFAVEGFELSADEMKELSVPLDAIGFEHGFTHTAGGGVPPLPEPGE